MSDIDYNSLLASAYQVQAVKYVTVASLAIFVYDYFLTLEREIRLIWNSRWGFGKTMYLLARYPAFVDVPLTLWHTLVGYHSPAPSPRKCLIIYTVTTWATVFGIAMAEGILFLRTYALFHGNKKVLCFLIAFFTVMLTVDTTIAEFFLRSLKFGAAPPAIQSLGGCHITEGSKIIFIDFCTIIFQETIILSMTMYKGIKTFRQPNHLLRLFYRDGVFYYVYIFFISAGNIIVLVTGTDDLLDLLDTFQRVMHSVLATRILLHIRDAMDDNFDSPSMISDMKFGSRPAPASRSTATQSSGGDTRTGVSVISEVDVMPAHPDW